MGNPIREIEYDGFDGLWKLNVNEDNISVEKDGEVRVYDLNDITKVENELEYVYLNKYGGGFYQVKFEVDSFLVIDEFDEEGEHLVTIGSHIFGE